MGLRATVPVAARKSDASAGSSDFGSVAHSTRQSRTTMPHFRLTALKAVDVAASEDGERGGGVALGADEHVIGLGVRLVTVELDMVIRDVMLMANLSAVVGERPVEEVVDFSDEANVIIDRALVVRGTSQSPVESVHSPR